MKMSDFDPKVIGKNLKELMADSKAFLVELIFILVPFIFIGFVWLPFFTARTSPVTHFIFSDFAGIFSIVFLIIWVGALVLYVIARLTILKPYTLFFRVFLVAIEALYLGVALQTFGIYNAFINFVNVHLNVGFYFLMLHFIAMVVFTAIPTIIEKAILGAYNKKPAPAPEKPAETKVLEAEVTEPKPEAPVEEAKPEEPKVEEVKPEEPKVEEKPKPKKKPAEPKAE